MISSTACGLTSAFSFLILPPKILHLRRLVQPGLEAGTAFLDPVEHRVERSQARPPLGRTIADLLDDLALFLLGSLQRPGNLLALVGFVADRGCEVAANLRGDVVEHAHAEEGRGKAG